MSLMKTLARVAAGVMLAKGIGAVMRNQSGSSQRGRADGRGGGLLDDLFGNNLDGQGQGNLRDRLGQVLGGRSGSQAGTGQAYGGRGSGGARGGLGGLLDGLGAGGSASGSGLGGLLGQLSGAGSLVYEEFQRDKGGAPKPKQPKTHHKALKGWSGFKK